MSPETVSEFLIQSENVGELLLYGPALPILRIYGDRDIEHVGPDALRTE
jgi:hypothetical protein